MTRMKDGPERGSHLPLLMYAISQTTGAVVELGCGMYSTPYLHWACWPRRRKLVTIENNPDFYDYAKQFESANHEIRCVDNWADVDLGGPWDVAFVDHQPAERRGIELIRLSLVSQYVVAHDTENKSDKKYHYRKAHPYFKYRFKYTDTKGTFASIYSNYHNISKLVI